jgi:hypothetical protein
MVGGGGVVGGGAGRTVDVGTGSVAVGSAGVIVAGTIVSGEGMDVVAGGIGVPVGGEAAGVSSGEGDGRGGLGT